MLINRANFTFIIIVSHKFFPPSIYAYSFLIIFSWTFHFIIWTLYYRLYIGVGAPLAMRRRGRVAWRATKYLLLLFLVVVTRACYWISPVKFTYTQHYCCGIFTRFSSWNKSKLYKTTLQLSIYDDGQEDLVLVLCYSSFQRKISQKIDLTSYVYF